MSKQKHIIPRHNKNTTFNGVRFVLPTNVRYDLTGASIYINFATNTKDSTVPSLIMSTTAGSIAIVSEYMFDIVEQMINLTQGIYYWDCKIIFANGMTKVYIGGTWTIDDIITE